MEIGFGLFCFSIYLYLHSFLVSYHRFVLIVCLFRSISFYFFFDKVKVSVFLFLFGARLLCTYRQVGESKHSLGLRHRIEHGYVDQDEWGDTGSSRMVWVIQGNTERKKTGFRSS